MFGIRRAYAIPGHPYFEGRFLEKASEKKHNNLLDNSQENICLFVQCGMSLPFREFEACNDETFTIKNTGYCDILDFIVESGMSPL